MKILILGAGVVGTASAWYLAASGHEPVVLDRREGAGLETSFANGGQVSAAHSEPWANPGAPGKIAKWLWRDDSPLLFRLRLDPRQWAWGAQFLYECMPHRTRENIARLTQLALYSRASLKALRGETGIAYDHLERGILQFFTDAREFDAAVHAVDLMRRFGLDRDVKTPGEAVAIEPALAAARDRIVGATYTASDESGDAHLFTQRLAVLAERRGADFRYGHTVLRLQAYDGEVKGVEVRTADGEEKVLKADAYVVALGSYSPLVTRPVGVDIPVYPAKGYSASVRVIDPARAPTVSLTDDAAKIVISRLGDRLRIAGTAELAGYDTSLNAVRCEALTRRVSSFFPGAADYGNAVFWTGLRPSTPSNVPLIGPTRLGKLWLNTGHGTLGWTLACGSGRVLADLLSGRKPGVELPGPR